MAMKRKTKMKKLILLLMTFVFIFGSMVTVTAEDSYLEPEIYKGKIIEIVSVFKTLRDLYYREYTTNYRFNDLILKSINI